MKRKQLGNDGERAAVNYLKKHGFKILETNFTTNFGEIDIIARQKKCVHFVEVRTVSTNYLYGSRESINNKKQDKIKQVANYYYEIFLYKNKKIQETCFSVIEIKFENEKFNINFIPDAFN